MTDEFHAFRPVPKTGVIYVTSEAMKLGFTSADPDWCNLGQGQPETGDLPGADASAGDAAALDDEWPPRADRARACFWLGASELERGSYWHASRSFLEAAAKAAGPTEAAAGQVELARGLFHLAVAGFKGISGDGPGKARQLVHARRRLAPFLPRHDGLDLELAELLAVVEADLRGPGDPAGGS